MLFVNLFYWTGALALSEPYWDITIDNITGAFLTLLPLCGYKVNLKLLLKEVKMTDG